MFREPAAAPRKSFLKAIIGWLLTVSILPAGFVTAVYVSEGSAQFQKALYEIVMPASLVFLVLVAMLVGSLFRGELKRCLAILAITALYYAAANPILSQRLLGKLEATYPAVDVPKLEPLDTVVVLGGGSGANPSGGPQFNGAGDRLALAIRLYHSKLASRIVVTGDPMENDRQADFETDPSIQSKVMLMQSGVAESDIVEIGGTNTSEEIESLAKQPDLLKGRCGLITSAFHLPRAMRLAQAKKLELIPLPADFRVGPPLPAMRNWIPTSAALGTTDIVIKEYLAKLVGR